MEGVTLIETKVWQSILSKIDTMSEQFNQVTTELKDLKSPYLDTAGVMDLTGFGKTWVHANKHVIGGRMVGGELRFKRSEVTEFMEQKNFKPKRK